MPSAAPSNAFKAYLGSVRQALAAGNSTEHTFRSMLEALVAALGQDLRATNEPQRIACGAPDFIVTRRNVPLGYIEAKDVGQNLDKIEDDSQLRRYRASLGNLILTDYLEFRWYVDGAHRISARLASLDRRGTLKTLANGTEEVHQLLQAFLHNETPILNSPRELAVRMAQLAQLIRDIIGRTFAAESPRGPLHSQLEAFQKVLVHDMTPPEFGDMYAQTICYGLFAARCNHVGPNFTRASAAFELPKTNPFLRRLFAHVAGPELDERIAWAVDDLTELLGRANITAILKDFGRSTRREDAVVHFYETFLAAYDPKLREARGVYYTPEPVVAYIARSIDAILRRDFELPKGLADATKVDIKSGGDKVSVHKVQILDPATGTGTFLFAVIDLIRDGFRADAGLWSSYVSAHLLPRVYGFELLMAPYAVAHMKLALQLRQSGYDFKSDERIRVYVTNTLEEAHEMAGLPLFTQWLAEEANSASRVKRDLPIMVILGNPPYSGVSKNTGQWIESLMESYKVTVREEERQIQRLSNDYVKFIRFAHWRLMETGSGVLGFVTDRGYLDGILFRDMRAALVRDFSDIYIYDLHGVAVRGQSREEDNDQNVFDIAQGVAIALFVLKRNRRRRAKVHYAQLRGTRAFKYERLEAEDVATTGWTTLTPEGPNWYLTPVQQDVSYASWPSLLDIAGTGRPSSDRDKRYGTGVKTRHDAFVIGWTPEDAVQRVQQIANRPESDAQLIKDLKLCTTAHFDVRRARERVERGDLRAHVRPIAFRPFDTRYLVYLREFVCEPKAETMRHMLREDNIALAALRRDRRSFGTGYFVARGLVAKDLVSNIDDALIWPLYVQADAPTDQQTMQWEHDVDWVPNLSQRTIRAVSHHLGLRFESMYQGDRRTTFGPGDVLAYIYAILNAPTFRERYLKLLTMDFPRIPFARDTALFDAIAGLGHQLIRLHLLEEDVQPITRYPISGDNAVSRVSFSRPTPRQPDGRVYINATQYFEGVSESVWDFHIGAYQVCDKWLKERKHRQLTFDELVAYQRVIATLSQTLELQRSIDAGLAKWSMKDALGFSGVS